ncbi:TetR family transcriptional regulator [Gordonia sp. SID5947]|uniref:TetR/AcrR family transcriptional regulator n=1 Tax=Gordonia sp. SID5947 TaxID=2690315 RepID=UPI0013701B21|nr:TetR/AcrR family transcriptional regulator [Gordonia sp. SID5947]MYR08292.1 TetR family transcriptional regulator [Gordonia sp. SID5947]
MTPPKAKRPKATAADIEAAFARSFLANGYRGTSVDAVAKDLGMPKGSIFYHIGTKEAVFFRVQMAGMREFTDRLREISESDEPAEIRLREAIRDSVRRVDPSAGPLFAMSRDNHHLPPNMRPNSRTFAATIKHCSSASSKTGSRRGPFGSKSI